MEYLFSASAALDEVSVNDDKMADEDEEEIDEEDGTEIQRNPVSCNVGILIPDVKGLV
jgi:hypothetical protein